jgi:hypothetical protein
MGVSTTRQAPRLLLCGTVLSGLLLAAPGEGGAAQLKLGWAGAGTDHDPGTWTITLTDAAAGAGGTYRVDGGPATPFASGITRVPVPNTLGRHTIEVLGPENLRLTDSRTIVDDAPTPPTLTVEYAGEGTRIRPGVWMITIVDQHGRRAHGTYRINDGPSRTLPAGSSVVAVPYFPGRYTITVTATNDDRDRPGDEKTVTVQDTREVR